LTIQSSLSATFNEQRNPRGVLAARAIDNGYGKDI